MGEGNSRTPRAYVLEESDSGIVPMNRSNKEGTLSAESEEGRPLIKENAHQSSTHSTQSEVRVSQGLAGVRKVARERKGTKFTALLHHLTVSLLVVSVKLWKSNLGDISARVKQLVSNPLIASHAAFN